jgi:hypothetical protein
MATDLRAKASELYEADFYVWALEQAELLRARRFEALDLGNLIEEVEGLADTKLSAVLSNAAVVIEHLLNLLHSPATDPRNGWRASVREHRTRLWIELTPRLSQILVARLPELYARARHDAAAGMHDHGEHAAAEALPEVCPYTLDQVSGDWWT